MLSRIYVLRPASGTFNIKIEKPFFFTQVHTRSIHQSYIYYVYHSYSHLQMQTTKWTVGSMKFLSRTRKSSNILILHCNENIKRYNLFIYIQVRTAFSTGGMLYQVLKSLVISNLMVFCYLLFRWHSLGYWTDNWKKPSEPFKIQEGWIPNAPERPIRECAFRVKRPSVAKNSAANCLGNATLAREKGL